MNATSTSHVYGNSKRVALSKPKDTPYSKESRFEATVVHAMSSLGQLNRVALSSFLVLNLTQRSTDEASDIDSRK